MDNVVVVDASGREKWGLATCRMGGCERATHRFGLCGKHRKWVEKGYMDLDLTPLKPMPVRNSYSGCKVDGCSEKHRRNGFCVRHDAMYKRGSMDRSGDRLVPERIYAPGTLCKVCSGGGRIVLGFCLKHYAAYGRGAFKLDGTPGHLRMVTVRCGSCRKPSRVWKKPVGVFYCHQWCREDAEKKALRAFDPPSVTVKARRLSMREKRCRVRGCGSNGYAKNLCVKHYSRHKNGHPLSDEAFFMNKGQTCSDDACEKPAVCAGMCSTHYSRARRTNPIDPQSSAML